ncbi:helix-Turn-Helix, type 11 protein [Arthrobacter sp. Hiyo8]|nr:helix-Turn-Helix, type 11 protein [Arthrobacter sp. Hiyo8]
MIQTSARLLQLLSLLQVRREWTGPALAKRMGVTERTVRRDIDKLRNLGYPIHASPGIAGGYQLGAGPSSRRCSLTTMKLSPSPWD